MLIKCCECGHDVSEYAQSCPNCGCPVSFSLKFPEPEIEDSDQLEELEEREETTLEESVDTESNTSNYIKKERQNTIAKIFGSLLIWVVIGVFVYFVASSVSAGKSKSESVPSVSSGRTSSSYKSSSSNSGSSSSSSKSTGSSYKGSSKVSDDYKGVLVACLQEAVKSQLKSPSSAKFPKSFSEYTFTNADGTWFVTGWVEAQNSFGASIRQNCDCFVMQEGTKFVPFLVTIGEESYFVE